MQKRNLTDKGIQALRPSDVGQRRIIWDALVPNLGLRISDKGHKSFVLVTRYPGQVNPASRSLGQYGKISLEEAREKAREWHTLIRQGRDPALERGETFAVVCGEYYAREGGRLRTAKDQQARLERLVMPTLGQRPISEIKRSEIIYWIKSKMNGGPKPRIIVSSIFRGLWAGTPPVTTLSRAPSSRAWAAAEG
jgi:hypothetical protein